MPASVTNLRYPCERVLLHRTKLAYVHLPHLLTDAKRDRAARVSGYVAIWLPEELVILYMRQGEVVNATRFDGHTAGPIPIADALERVPPEPELGEISFQVASEDQLGCMFQAHVREPVPWPPELNARDPTALFPHLMATTFDGVVEVTIDGHLHYLLFQDGTVQQGFLSDDGVGSLVDRVRRVFGAGRRGRVDVRRWDAVGVLPAQIAPALVQVYRDMMAALVHRLVADGRDTAPMIAEHARRGLLTQHPSLDAFPLDDGGMHGLVDDADAVTSAMAAWTRELIWAGLDHDSLSPEEVVREITRERRHLFQSAGFFDQLPWQVTW